MAKQSPLWANVGEFENCHLPDLLTFSSENYGRQTNWFLRHRDTGIRNLAVIIASETAITSLYFTTDKQIPPAFIIMLLLLLAFLAPLLALSALCSCKRAFRAAMENALLTAKIVWALGLTSNVEVKKSNVDLQKCPARDDLYLYVPRYVEDSLAHPTTKTYSNANLSNRKNTYFWGRFTIVLFCLGAILVGVIAACTAVYCS